MAQKKEKYYVVWSGREPGIYRTWAECERQVKGVEGARFKSYESQSEAEAAYANPAAIPQPRGPERVFTGGGTPESVLVKDPSTGLYTVRPGTVDPPELDALAVDAACSGNPGVMEYQGVYVATGTRVFHYRAERGTNNIGEFLALVHGLSYMKKHHLRQVIYSDSVNAMGWVRQGVCKSKLPVDGRTQELWDYVHRAEAWLRQNSYTTRILKWRTECWGEIPADFGRK